MVNFLCKISDASTKIGARSSEQNQSDGFIFRKDDLEKISHVLVILF